MLAQEFKKLEILSLKRTSKKSSTYEMRLYWPINKEVLPGQFVMLKPLGRSVMPRPFSIAKEGFGQISLYIKIVGENTRNFCNLQKGSIVEVLGPLGNPMDLNFAEKNVMLVAGGSGIAGIMLAASALTKKGKNIRVILGGRSAADLFALKHFTQLRCKTKTICELGKGRCGLVTDLVKDNITWSDCRIIACGPKPMLKCIASMASERNIPCMVQIEEVMACGIGSCKGCPVFGKDGTVKHVCTDGPVFDAKWIDWEKLIPSKIEVVKRKPKLPHVHSMETELKGLTGRSLRLKSPILISSGCFEYDNQDKGEINLKYVGAIVEKGLTLKPRLGNPAPRICEVKTGMLNSIGLENIGVERFIKEKLPRLKKSGKPVVANISGFTPQEYAHAAHLLNDSDVDAIEVNISCPNIHQGERIFGCSPTLTREVIRMVRHAAKDKFLITKHTPMAENIIDIVNESIDEGTDAISLINTILGMSIDVETRRPRIAKVYGGYSGPGIKPIGVRIVHQVFERIRTDKITIIAMGGIETANDITIIAMGGIETANDAIEYLLAGANAVSVGTANFKNYDVAAEIYTGIENYLEKQGSISVEDIVGKVIV